MLSKVEHRTKIRLKETMAEQRYHSYRQAKRRGFLTSCFVSFTSSFFILVSSSIVFSSDVRYIDAFQTSSVRSHQSYWNLRMTFTVTKNINSRLSSTTLSSETIDPSQQQQQQQKEEDGDRNEKIKETLQFNEYDKSGKQRLQFVSPLLLMGYPPTVDEYEQKTLRNKPLLLYLPGFDGTWVAPFLQFPELSTEFDVRCCQIDMQDRSTYDELKSTVIDYIIEQVKEEKYDENTTAKKKVAKKREMKAVPPKLTSRPVYIIGESFGGILALDVTLSLLRNEKDDKNDSVVNQNLRPSLSNINLKGLTLINSATCYDRSKLALEGPPVAESPNWWSYLFGLLKLLPLFTDEHSFEQLLLILRSKALPSVIDNAEREAYMGRVAFSLANLLKFMPQETLRWRLTEWLEYGCSRMSTRIGSFQEHRNCPILIVAGQNDLTLPSIAEAERLVSTLPNTKYHIVEGAGHASTCGSRIDLAAVMRNCFPELRRKGNIGSVVMNLGRGSSSNKRTSMKPVAAKGKGPYFGLEPRYNGKEEGLNPVLYWSKPLYKKWDETTQKKQKQE